MKSRKSMKVELLRNKIKLILNSTLILIIGILLGVALLLTSKNQKNEAIDCKETIAPVAMSAPRNIDIYPIELLASNHTIPMTLSKQIDIEPVSVNSIDVVSENSIEEEVISENIVKEEIELESEFLSVSENNVEEIVMDRCMDTVQESLNILEIKDVGGNGNFKSWMPHTVGSKSIFSKSSNQYKLQLLAETGNYGIRTVNGRYCAAVGSYFTTTIGTYFDIVLENGSVIPCILADAKADKHTDSQNKIHSVDGSVVEFIVDRSCLDKKAKQMGSLSAVSEEFNGGIEKIVIYDKVEEY